MKNRTTKLVTTASLLAGVVGLSTVGTLALFGDQDSVSANSFSTGTIALTTDPTSALVTFTSMMPGDAVTNSLVVTNAGTESLRYALSSVATDPDTKALKDQLALTVKTVDLTDPATPCDAFDGTPLYSGDLDSAAGLVLGSAVAGQTGEATTGGDRTLAPAAVETLCFRVNLPSATGDAFQGAATTATFTFDSEQTRNN